MFDFIANIFIQYKRFALAPKKEKGGKNKNKNKKISKEEELTKSLTQHYVISD